MINKHTLYILTTLILLTLSACQPKPPLEPSSQPLTTLPLATPPLATRHSATQPLATRHSTPATQPLKELVMPKEPTVQPPQPAADETTEPAAGTDSAQPTPEENLHPTILNWVNQAKEDLAIRQSLPTEKIELLSFEEKVWPNAGLGCPQPGMAYTQVMVEGYLIRLRSGKEIYNYHGGGSRPPFLCQQPSPKIIATKQAPLNIKQTPTKNVPHTK